MTENERVKAVRQALGLSQQEFGSRIGIKISAMSYLESGKSRLTESNAILICKEFNVSREWLLNGTGEMFLPESSDSLDALAEQYDLTPLEREILRTTASCLKPSAWRSGM